MYASIYKQDNIKNIPKYTFLVIHMKKFINIGHLENRQNISQNSIF